MLPRPSDLERALSKMLRTSFPGCCGSLQESLIAGEYFLRPVFPTLDCTAEMENVSGGKGVQLREACDPPVHAELVRMNAGDAKLVELARAEVGRRFLKD